MLCLEPYRHTIMAPCCRYVYEAGGMSVLGGVPFNVLRNSENGELDLDQVAAAIRCGTSQKVTLADRPQRSTSDPMTLVLTLSVWDSTGPWTSMRQALAAYASRPRTIGEPWTMTGAEAASSCLGQQDVARLVPAPHLELSLMGEC